MDDAAEILQLASALEGRCEQAERERDAARAALTEELAELERIDPAVKRAADNYDRVVAEILRKDKLMTFREACERILSEGYVPVQRGPHERLRAWLDETNGWPPKDWQPPDGR